MGTDPVRTVLTTYDADCIVGPTVRPHLSWDRGRPKDPLVCVCVCLCDARAFLKEERPMFLTNQNEMS